jgi:hypothetical protein
MTFMSAVEMHNQLSFVKLMSSVKELAEKCEIIFKGPHCKLFYGRN